MIPNKIYVRKEEMGDVWSLDATTWDNGGEQYIRKDALMEWLKQKIKDYWADDENTMGIYPYALEEVIDKINSL